MKREIFPIFLSGYPCNHHCIYCQPVLTSGVADRLDMNELKREISEWLASDRRSVPREIALYGTDLAAVPDCIRQPLLDHCAMLREQGCIDDLRISIRPDTVNSVPCETLRSFTVIEIGVPSMDSEVLHRIQREHGVDAVNSAVARLRGLNIRIGCQTMLGLPGASRASDLASARAVAALKPDFVRIHPTLVLHDTVLAQLFTTGVYTPMTIEEAVVRSTGVWDIYAAAEIPVTRCGFHIPEKLRERALAAGPWHPAFGQKVRSRRWRERFREQMTLNPTMTVLEVPAGHLSDAIGQHSENIHWLESYFNRPIRIEETR